MKLLITGCAGFIGTNLTLRLLQCQNVTLIYGIDNFADNYEETFKQTNLNDILLASDIKSRFIFIKDNVLTFNRMAEISPDVVVHLASTPGVRKSLENPQHYVRNNVEAFVHLLEECKRNNVQRIVYASSSSVYGGNEDTPFRENDTVEKLRSSYACSKRCMEVYAKYYHDVFGLETVGLRFFTVYGPRGRPDMAPYMFLKKISDESELLRFGNGTSYRDYTYIDDIVNGIIASVYKPGIANGCVYNLGNESPVTLNDFIALCEKVVRKSAKIHTIENQTGDVPKTHACTKEAQKHLNYKTTTSLEDGLRNMYAWMQTSGIV